MTEEYRSDMLAQLEADLIQRLALDIDASQMFSRVLERVPALISVVSETGEVIFASAQHVALSGVNDSLCDIKFEQDLFPAFVADRFSPSIGDLALKDEMEAWELSAQHKDGQVHVYDMLHSVVQGEKGRQFVLSIGIDVTRERQKDQSSLHDHKSQLNYLSFHDSLTGLANRSLFYDRVHKSLSRARRGTSNIALLLLDLDRFKIINDSLGRDAGDYYLKQTAIRLSESVRDTDTVARLSGDEFVVVLENIAQSGDIENIANKILEAISMPVSIQDHEISATASMGISLFPRDGETVDQLLKYADLAMSRAKAMGKNRTQFYVKAMADNAVNYLLLENDLRKAIDGGDLCLHYQPQIDLHSGKIAGLEALVRWQHKERGLISPAEFIPLAEETGLIESLGNWVLKQACSDFKAWLLRGLHFGKVAVNLSPRQFRQDDFDQVIIKTLLETRLSPEYLELEITESSAMENAAETIELLNSFANMGLSLAIDDFGTGYSSLSYLKRFPINKLKIDRSFIKDIDTDEADAAIAKSIVDLAHNMSLNVVAEGVERATQAEWLLNKGCDQIQGFYYARPMAEDKLLEWVSDESRIVIGNDSLKLASITD